MLVCICNGVTERHITSAIENGASEFREIKSSLGLGSCCGQCVSFAKEMVNKKANENQQNTDFHLAQEIAI